MRVSFGTRFVSSRFVSSRFVPFVSLTYIIISISKQLMPAWLVSFRRRGFRLVVMVLVEHPKVASQGSIRHHTVSALAGIIYISRFSNSGGGSTIPERSHMPPTTSSLFAVCCRCHARSAYATSWTATRTGAALRYTTVANSHLSPADNHDTTPTTSGNFGGPSITKTGNHIKDVGGKSLGDQGHKLLVLPPPRPDFKAPNVTISPLDKLQLADLSNAVLTYEMEALLDATNMEISLARPLKPRVSQQRYDQLYNQLSQAFNMTQLQDYFESAVPEDTTAPPDNRRLTRKSDVIHAVMRDRWKMVVTEEIAEREDVIVLKEINITTKDIFFLIGEGMSLAPLPHSLFGCFSFVATGRNL